jgi:predicted AlkP superfamily pyrophosphatase or phosphodiesterase
MKPVLWILAVGLSERQIGPETPVLARLGKQGARAPMSALLPGVTLAGQATQLTGRLPREHGIVGNGWYWPELGEVLLWRQPYRLLGAPTIHDMARQRWPQFTSAMLFAWFNMGAPVDWALTPRPFYPADGRKIPAVQSWPGDLARRLESEFGTFPFFDFWGPRAGLPSSYWLTEATRSVLRTERPTLTTVYLPHLDYDHQRYGPDDPRSLKALVDLDIQIGKLLATADQVGAEVMITSEYALEEAQRVIHVNRALRSAGLLAVRETPTGEVLDTIGSRAFAVADHQIAHVHCRDTAARHAVRELLADLPGVAEVLADDGKRTHGLDHPRAGDYVLVAERGAWFSYYYWLDESAAPDFARTVDIHRKPGYDPAELFIDPNLAAPKLRVVRRLLQKKLGMRYLMDVIPLDATLVRGTHGRLPDRPEEGPLFLCSRPFEQCGGEPAAGVVPMTSIPERLLALLGRP